MVSIVVETNRDSNADTDTINDFVRTAELNRLDGLHQDALVMLLRGLSENPDNHQGRLLLARVLFELGCVPFALNELQALLTHFPQNVSLKKLYRELAGRDYTAPVTTPQTIVAESVIDFDAIEELVKE